jgi:hypothetical protein
MSKKSQKITEICKNLQKFAKMNAFWGVAWVGTCAFD